MNEAPEGLEYGHDNEKYCHANMLEQHLEKGKYATGGSPEHEKAEMLRMLHQGSHDPMYHDSKKNM